MLCVFKDAIDVIDSTLHHLIVVVACEYGAFLKSIFRIYKVSAKTCMDTLLCGMLLKLNVAKRPEDMR